MITITSRLGRLSFATAAAITLTSSLSAQAQTLLYQDFDGFAPGTPLTSTGLGYQQITTYGAAPAFVGEVAGFGNSGTSPNGAIMVASTVNEIGEFMHPLGTLPADGHWTIKLTCDAFITSATYNSGIYLAGSGTSQNIGWWGGWPMGNPNNFGLDARSATGHSGGDANYIAGGNYSDQVVHLSVEINALDRTIQGSIERADHTIEQTGVIHVVDGVDLTSYNNLGILQDSRGGWGGMALDNVAVTLTAVPEPSSMALVAGGMLAGFAWLRRRQSAVN